MLSFLRTTRETAAARKAAEGVITLRAEIERTQCTMETVQNLFEQVTDPMLIDCYIYELNAAQLRYQFLLRSIKEQESIPSSEI